MGAETWVGDIDQLVLTFHIGVVYAYLVLAYYLRMVGGKGE